MQSSQAKVDRPATGTERGRRRERERRRNRRRERERERKMGGPGSKKTRGRREKSPNNP